MKKWVLLLVCFVLTILCSAAMADVKIDVVNFPDSDFRTIVQTYDENHDNRLSDAEIAKVEEIYCTESNIASLKGIEFFSNLKRLHCYRNVLTSLDVSKNKKLEYLYCMYNQLSELDVSKNKYLSRLFCDGNRLTSIDVSRNTSLEMLSVSDNKIKKIDVSNNTVLQQLYCNGNQLTEVDVTHNPKLDTLNCSFNQVKKLDISQNTILDFLCVTGNKISSLDFSHNPKLRDIFCGKNQLSKLNVSMLQNLELLSCESNKLSSLDVRKCLKLTDLFCESNRLKELNVSKNKNLTLLNCHFNKLTKLDISKCPTLCGYVKTKKRETRNGYDYFGIIEDSEETTPMLSVDRTVTVKAGARTSEATLAPGAVSIGGLQYKLNDSSLTATFIRPDNKNAKSLHIPGNIQTKGKTYAVTKITAGACEGMKKLATLIIGGNVEEIGKNAFKGCIKLKSITIKTVKLKKGTIGTDAFKTGYPKGTVKCPAKKLKSYQKILLTKGLKKTTKFTK